MGFLGEHLYHYITDVIVAQWGHSRTMQLHGTHKFALLLSIPDMTHVEHVQGKGMRHDRELAAVAKQEN